MFVHIKVIFLHLRFCSIYLANTYIFNKYVLINTLDSSDTDIKMDSCFLGSVRLAGETDMHIDNDTEFGWLH